MSLETFFIRKVSTKHDEPCDVAHVLLRKTTGDSQQAYYLGTRLGRYAPKKTVARAVLDISEVWAWVGSQGYERVPNEPE